MSLHVRNIYVNESTILLHARNTYVHKRRIRQSHYIQETHMCMNAGLDEFPYM